MIDANSMREAAAAEMSKAQQIVDLARYRTKCARHELRLLDAEEDIALEALRAATARWQQIAEDGS